MMRRVGLLLLVLLLSGGVRVSDALAHGGVRSTADWEPTGLTHPASRLFNPTSGALLVTGAGKLHRSDDGGTVWREVTLPPGADSSFAVGTSYSPAHIGPGQIAVDPSNHDVLFARAGGLHKSIDGGATWAPQPVEGKVVAVAVSPADSAYIHAISGTTEGWQRVRSRDGGTNWEQIANFKDTPPAGRPEMDYAVYLLQPHPTDPERIFIAAGGTTGRSTQVGLYDGHDGTGPRLGAELKFDPGNFVDAEHLVGGGDAAPGRFYGAFNARVTPYNQTTTAKLLRADEGGAQTVLLEVRGGGSTNNRANGDVLAPAVFIDAIAYDPSAPDRVYAGLNEYQVVVTTEGPRVQLNRIRSHVITSSDGGGTWSDLGREDLGSEIRDLALGIDGAYIYAATEGGVHRLRLDTAALR